MENKLQHTCATTREFALQLLEHITNNFSEERIIGRGGYGVVYKGVLEDGQEIAVKKLHHMPGLDDKQFRNEFNNFMRVQHQNIVRLVGYCYDIGHQRIKHNGEYIFAHVEERLLCFEYLQGGSLDKHVSDESCRLDWPSCYKIIKGVCEGLNYLHNGSKDPMYHLDLKPANILLDKDMTPKIGDFGLSRLFPSAHTYITTKIVGTRGYMPPEYIDRYQITPKFDVFSLGVIIIQIMAGRVGYSKCADIPSQEFIKLVHENWRKKMQPTMLSHTSHGVKTCIEIALRCVETDRVKRPTIAEIVNELNKIDTTIVDELNEFDDTRSSPIAQCRSLERKLGGLMHKVSDLRSKQAFNQYASSGGRLLPLPETLSAKPLRGHVYSHNLRRRNLRKKWVRWLLLLLSVVGWSITCFWFWFFLSQNSMQVEVRRKSLASMCDQYASMVQDQFSVSMYYLQALAILVSTFHHSQNPSAIDQTTSAWYAKRTAFEFAIHLSLILQLCILYQTKDTKGRSIGLLHRWRVLEHHPNWTSRLSQKKQKTASNASPTTSSLCFTTRLHTVWLKKIEREDKKEAKKEAWCERALAIEEKMMALEESMQAIEKNKIALEQQKLDFQRRSDDERIMSMDVSAMANPQQQYYISLQREIIARQNNTLG